jgi:hypothetical protein
MRSELLDKHFEPLTCCCAGTGLSLGVLPRTLRTNLHADSFLAALLSGQATQPCQGLKLIATSSQRELHAPQRLCRRKRRSTRVQPVALLSVHTDLFTAACSSHTQPTRQSAVTQL